MNQAQKQNDELKEFIKIALELKAKNQKLFEGYKNRMIGAIEVQRISKN